MASIKLEGISLDYIIKTGSDSIKKVALNFCNTCLGRSSSKAQRVRNSSYRALNNLNLDINIGDGVGLLGRNGAGKSTLLKVIAKVYQPNIGSIKVKGKISSLFDVNLGMNVEATGYENIINLSIMRGYSKKQAQEIIPDIEAFTELGDFLNNPVRTYSTGMQMKLAFAVATAYTPEIMLIDEVIGVGDAHFMEKATKRLENLLKQSHIFVLTSHSSDVIKRFCNKVVVLDQGEIKFIGDVDAGITFYNSQLSN
jgi:ABC-type polysaccharide/polyol phosphate transport system ATPase subunit